ncbi:hypothetical protein [Streptomyces mirabilis]|uniref:hypothetical protein n=1 Tax=Streptomyces mirabilis TaxID=68239 RepID=UPI0033A89865
MELEVSDPFVREAEVRPNAFKALLELAMCNGEYVVDIHRGWTTQDVGPVDTMWALVWHFDADGQVDRVVNLSGDQHQMDNYVWANFPLAPLPARLA